MDDSPFKGRDILRGWKEISEVLGVHEKTAKLYYREKNMPVTQIGRMYFITRNALLKWIEGRQ
jgi:hypothetical protein